MAADGERALGSVERVETESLLPATDLLKHGHATVVLTQSDRGILRLARQEAYRFFQLGKVEKLRHVSPDFHFGFRPFGRQYSLAPERPDINESVAYWSDDVHRIPEGDRIEGLLIAMEAARTLFARVARMALDQLERYYRYPEKVSFEQASCIEFNWYLEHDERELLQDRHEDGHLFTILMADAPGLEIEVLGHMRPISFNEGEVLLMPGRLLTYMTGGHVAPLYHQVRNHHLDTRLSFLYQVNPLVFSSVRPFVVNESNRDVDIAEQARGVGQAFGLPKPPLDQSRAT